MSLHRLRRLAATAAAVLVAPAVAGAVLAAEPASAAGALAPTVTALTTAPVVGAAARFRFGTAAGSAPVTQFVFSLNSGPGGRVTAANGRATASVVVERAVNVLSVYAVAADGSVSDSTVTTFNAAFPPPAADQDLDSDGKPDLLAVGGTPGLAPGLWQATGRGLRGQVRTPAVDIGVNGNGVGTPFTGAQVFTGKFRGGPFEDVFVYYPGGINPGSGMIIDGLGRGEPLRADRGYEATLSAGLFADINNDNPLQLVNAYDGSGNHFAYPDLLGIVGSPANGYTLQYYASQNGTANFAFPTQLGTATPTGGGDWEHWRLASKLLPSGTAVALWNQSTGALYLWQGVTYDQGTGALAFTQFRLADAWLPGAQLSELQLTDVNADGVPDLWAVTPDGTVTAYVITNLSATGPAKLTAKTPQHLT
ncbi:hypothetical protein AB0J72_10250 [Dactylosporangium sp. NPDC049742]|uniref:hypothetical protein n=1 Tax=Dactylosporangium sp. NPDC049742 TaxID=3154737 RepID=UPI00342D732B